MGVTLHGLKLAKPAKKWESRNHIYLNLFELTRSREGRLSVKQRHYVLACSTSFLSKNNKQILYADFLYNFYLFEVVDSNFGVHTKALILDTGSGGRDILYL